MDVKIYSLHGYIEDTIYIEKLEGFVEDISKVCLLKKCLYALKQSPMQWYHQFSEFLLKHGLLEVFMKVMYTYFRGMRNSFSLFLCVLMIF